MLFQDQFQVDRIQLSIHAMCVPCGCVASTRTKTHMQCVVWRLSDLSIYDRIPCCLYVYCILHAAHNTNFARSTQDKSAVHGICTQSAKEFAISNSLCTLNCVSANASIFRPSFAWKSSKRCTHASHACQMSHEHACLLSTHAA